MRSNNLPVLWAVFEVLRQDHPDQVEKLFASTDLRARTVTCMAAIVGRSDALRLLLS